MAGRQPPESRTVPQAPVKLSAGALVSEASPVTASAIVPVVAADALAPPNPLDLSPGDRARELADARRWSGTMFIGTSVLNRSTIELFAAPWTASFGDEMVVGGAVQYRLGRFWRFFMVDMEAGGIYRLGDTNGGEFWAAAYLRYDGFVWTDYVYTTIGVSMGPSYVTRLPQVERGTDRRPTPNQSRWLNFFAPELTLALPDYPQYEVALRYHHRSGIWGTYNGVYEGANSFVVGLRYRF